MYAEQTLSKEFNYKVNWLQNQKSESIAKTVNVIEFLNAIKEGQFSKDLVLKSRILEKSNSLYASNKSLLPHIIVGVNYNDNSSTTFSNISSFNNLIFIDFDEVANPQLLKNQLIELNIVLASWLSMGGHGVGAIVKCQNIKNADHYKHLYNQISDYIESETGYKCDSQCSNANRKIALSYDETLLINYSPVEFVPTQSNFKFIKSDKDNTNYDFEIESDFISYLNQLILIEKIDIREKYFIVDKNKFPVPFKKFKYDNENHLMVKHIGKNIIQQYPNKNITNTLAVSDNFISIVEYCISPKTKLKEGYRKKALASILYNYIFMNKGIIQRNINNRIYTLLHFMNSNLCYDRTGTYKKPLESKEIISLVKHIIEKVNEGIFPVITRRKAIYSNELYINYKLYESDLPSTFLKYFFKEIRSINKQKRLNRYELLINKYKGIATSFCNLCSIISKNHEISDSTVRRNLELLLEKGLNIQTQTNPIILKDSIYRTLENQSLFIKRKKENTENQINTVIIGLLTENIKINVKLIAERTGLSEKSVKRYWINYKSKIKIHNKQLK